MDSSVALRKHLSEDILLLCSLEDVVDFPSRYKLPRDDGSRRLPFDQEVQICQAFARLSALDAAKSVTAVALEEDRGVPGMVIRVASNNGGLNSNLEALRELTRHLESAATRKTSRPGTRDTFFKLIVKVEQKKILSRLYSKHVPIRKGFIRKSNFVQELKKCINAAPQNGETAPLNLDSLRARVADLDQTFSTLEETAAEDIEQKLALTEKMVEKAAGLMRYNQLPQILGIISGKETSKKMIREINSVGQYHSISMDLIGAARGYPELFRKVSVNTISRPSSYPGFSKGDLSNFDSIQQRLQLGQLPAKTAHSYSDRRINFSKPKIHAEVQLLLFYNSWPQPGRPRVICSSKDACFLCNKLFQIHQSFYIPGSHGRLYSSWILPTYDSDPTAQEKVDELAKVLDKQIQRLIKRTVAKPRRIRLPDPKESTPYLCRPFQSVSTVNSVLEDGTVFTRDEESSVQSPFTPIHASPLDEMLPINAADVEIASEEKPCGHPTAAVSSHSNIPLPTIREEILSTPKPASPTARPQNLTKEPLCNVMSTTTIEGSESDDAMIAVRPKTATQGATDPPHQTSISPAISVLSTKPAILGLSDKTADTVNNPCARSLSASTKWQVFELPAPAALLKSHCPISASIPKIQAPGISVHVAVPEFYGLEFKRSNSDGDGNNGNDSGRRNPEHEGTRRSAAVDASAEAAQSPHLLDDARHRLYVTFKYVHGDGRGSTMAAASGCDGSATDVLLVDPRVMRPGVEVVLDRGGVLSEKKLALVGKGGHLLIGYETRSIIHRKHQGEGKDISQMK